MVLQILVSRWREFLFFSVLKNILSEFGKNIYLCKGGIVKTQLFPVIWWLLIVLTNWRKRSNRSSKTTWNCAVMAPEVKFSTKGTSLAWTRLTPTKFPNVIRAPILAVSAPAEALDQKQRLGIPKHQYLWDDGDAPYLQEIYQLGKVHSLEYDCTCNLYNFYCFGPKISFCSIFQMNICMKKHGSCNIRDGLNSSFCNTILMKGICPIEVQLLVMFIYVSNKSIWLENSIVCQIVIHSNTKFCFTWIVSTAEKPTWCST